MPSKAKSRSWGIVIDPIEYNVPTKTGEFDDCVLLDSPGREDLAVVLKFLLKQCKASSDRLFGGLTLATYNSDISQACGVLGLERLRLTAHMLRHSGPSHDSYHKVRSLDAIQQRGRWKALSSMNRYRKPGRMLILHQMVPEQVWASAPMARRNLIQEFSKPFRQ